jgi:hypothetical protein
LKGVTNNLKVWSAGRFPPLISGGLIEGIQLPAGATGFTIFPPLISGGLIEGR